MQLGAITSGLLDRPLSQAAAVLHKLGLKHIELPAGGIFPRTHCHPGQLLADASSLDQFQATLKQYELTLTSLAIHGHPLHPDPKVAGDYDQQFQDSCCLAEKLGLSRLVLLAGLPEAAPGDKSPNWILFPFPEDYRRRLEWQWTQRVVPYWKDHVTIAERHGVKLCFEMVPADVVYNPETLLRLRDAVGPSVGANLDPSHFFFQGIDPLEAIRLLDDTIYYVHAKDSRIDPHNSRTNGTLDPKPMSDTRNRSWLYRTIGYGHDESFWCDFVSTLRQIGYDDVVSIEHEDPLIDPAEGFEKAVRFMKNILLENPPVKLWDA
jgi:sugar phosphate isomerase/epimerase